MVGIRADQTPLVVFQRQLFTYWHQGVEQAPAIVKACVSSFRRHHDRWELICLDSDSVNEWLEPFPIREARLERLSLAHKSDLIRTQLLLRYGGVWADPTVFFAGCLDTWLPVNQASSLFLFSRPGRDRLISNWFIAAAARNELLQILYERLCEYWDSNEFVNLDGGGQRRSRMLSRILNRNLFLTRLWLRKPFIRVARTSPYMIYHYLFNDLVASDHECAEIWRAVPKISADLPHRLQSLGLLEPMTHVAKDAIDDPRVPLFKLTWKLGTKQPPEGSILQYLLEHDKGNGNPPEQHA